MVKRLVARFYGPRCIHPQNFLSQEWIGVAATAYDAISPRYTVAYILCKYAHHTFRSDGHIDMMRCPLTSPQTRRAVARRLSS